MAWAGNSAEGTHGERRAVCGHARARMRAAWPGCLRGTCRAGS